MGDILVSVREVLVLDLLVGSQVLLDSQDSLLGSPLLLHIQKGVGVVPATGNYLEKKSKNI